LKNRGRSLRRYLGLRRKKGGSVHSGGIEHLLPGRISGWVVAKGVALLEVRLLVGPHLIARAEINQSRPDVCEALGWEGQPGFTIVLPALLPAGLPPLQGQGQPRLLALSADGSLQVELQLVQRPQQTQGLLEALLQSDLLGLDGHCDGILQGAIRGWAGRRGQSEPAGIWLQAPGQEPCAVQCNQWREGMQVMGLPPRSGFSVDPYELPPGWGGREVWFSFDRDGQFRLPQVEPVILPAGFTRSVAQMLPTQLDQTERRTLVKGSQESQLEAKPEDLRSHWQALESFRRYLDDLEQELDRRDRTPLPPPANKPKWWTRLLGPVG
jgi:hypothetical protein